MCECKSIHLPLIVGGRSKYYWSLSYFNLQLIAEIFQMYPTALLAPIPLIAQVPRLYILVTWALSSLASIQMRWLQYAGMTTNGQISLIVKVSLVMIAEEQDTKRMSNPLLLLKVFTVVFTQQDIFFSYLCALSMFIHWTLYKNFYEALYDTHQMVDSC